MSRALFGLATVIVLGIGGYFLWSMNGSSIVPDSTQGTHETYTSSELGLSFSYTSGRGGYELAERTPTEAGHLRTITLMRFEDAERMRTNPPIGGEGPAVISIDVFKNTQKQFSLAWAQANQQYSNYNLKTGTSSEVVVGGESALAYAADGLYSSQIIVVAHGENMYVITGQFPELTSQQRRDFQPIVDSIRFISTPGQGASGKLNIDLVCQGALAYMTFPDGAAAERFVAECKEGKHPEVIDRYKADHNLGDGAAI